MERGRLALIPLVLASSGCPEHGPLTPVADLSVQFHLEPPGTQTISGGQTLTLRVVVDEKGILNAGVEFEVSPAPPAGITATLNPVRIAETARETQLVIVAADGIRPGDYDFTMRARLRVNGQGAPNWTPTNVPLRVPLTQTGFELQCDVELAIPAGAARTLTCRTLRQPGFDNIIDLSFAAHPNYVMFYPEAASVGPDVGGFAFTVVRSLDAQTPAFLDVVAFGRSGGLTRQNTVRLHFPAN